MSFASSMASPAYNGARSMLRGGTLPSMARAVGMAVAGGIFAASYHLVHEEGREALNAWRTNRAHRRNRNDAVTLALMETELPLPAQDRIRRSRDAFRAAMALVTDETTPENYRVMIREALNRLIERSRD